MRANYFFQFQSIERSALRSGSHHALWNMRASWMLAAVLVHPSGCGFHGIVDPNDSLRALEAALFMIGYVLGQ